MVRQFISKEIVESLSGPKFLITFVICTALILTSVYTGYQLYEAEASWHQTAKMENKRALENRGSYGTLKTEGSKATREPERMSIFVRGVDSTVGKASTVGDDANIVLRDSRFGLNPIFAVFGELDLAFIVKIILALFALLFSYNAISGERELGTLKQVLSNSVGRASFILGKSVGGLITLFITFLLPLLIALLMLMVFFGVTFTGDEWARVGLMTLVFCVYLAVFFMVGMLMSALTRNSFVSFLLCLFVWVLSVVIVPRIAVEAAGRISPAPSIDRVEAERASISRNYYAVLRELLTRNLTEALQSDPNASREVLRQVGDRARAEARERFAGTEEALLREYEQRQIRLLNTAESIARTSPTSCVTFAVSRLAYTDAEMRERFLRSLRRFRLAFLDYADEKIRLHPELANSGTSTSISVTDDDEGNISFRVGVRTPEHILDTGDAPVFSMASEPLAASAAAIVPDVAILVVEFFLLFAAAFVAFLRYDVR